jgi:hypothetical protein
MLNGFGTIVNALGKRVKPYLPQICGTILWRLNNKSAKVRQQAADLISRIAVVMKTCQVPMSINVFFSSLLTLGASKLKVHPCQLFIPRSSACGYSQ